MSTRSSSNLEISEYRVSCSHSKDSGSLVVLDIPPLLTTTNEFTDTSTIPMNVITGNLEKSSGAFILGIESRQVDFTIELNIDILEARDVDQSLEIVSSAFGENDGTTILTGFKSISNTDSIIRGTRFGGTSNGSSLNRSCESNKCEGGRERRNVNHCSELGVFDVELLEAFDAGVFILFFVFVFS